VHLEDKKYTFLAIVLIIATGCAVYANSLNGKFIWDDRYLIQENIYVKDTAFLLVLLKTDIGRGAGVKSASYRPLQMLTYMLNYSAGGLDTRGYHLINILFHVLAALAIFGFVNIVFNDRVLSLFTGLFFVTHPIHTEVVTYISGRADSMALFFMLLSFIFYLKHLSSNSPALYIIMLLSYIGALLSRESALLLPALLVLYHYVFKKNIKFKPFSLILGISFAYILLRTLVIKTDLPSDTCATGLFQRIPGFFVAISNYIKLLLFPFGLHMEYGDKVFGMGDPRALFGIVISVLLLIYAFRKRNENKIVFFSVLWFFIALLPSANIYPINAYMAEHWLYLPSVGFFLILAKGARLVFTKRGMASFAIAVTLLVFYSSLTIRQNGYWREPIAFYKRTLQYAPDSSRVHNDLGITYYNRGEIEKAMAHYKKAIELDPASAGAYNNLGVAYKDSGLKEEAITAYKKAIELDPGHAEAHSNLGLSYAMAGKREEAITAYLKAIELDPNPTEAYSNLATLYGEEGKHEKAIIYYGKAIESNPFYANAYNNLGNTYKSMGRYEDAVALYEKALELNANPAAVHNNLALAYFLNGEYKLAVKHYDMATRLGHGPDPEFLKKLKPHR